MLGLIYDDFGDKDGLFDAVLDEFTEQAVSAVPIDADDLPAYAGLLFRARSHGRPAVEASSQPIPIASTSASRRRVCSAMMMLPLRW